MFGMTSKESTNALDLLKQDHDEVDAMFRQFEDMKDDGDEQAKESLVEKICDAEGNIAPTVADLAYQGKLDAALNAQLDEFFEDLADAHVVLHDISASNIACGLNADGKPGLYLIDGFGGLPLIPVYAWSKRLNRRRIERKSTSMRARLQARLG